MKRHITTAFFIALLLIPATASADASSAAYNKARPCYAGLTSEAGASAPEKEWRSCIARFERIYEDWPTSSRAPAALFSAAKLKLALYEKTRQPADAEGAIKDLNLLVREFPRNSLADDALYEIGVARRDVFNQSDRAERAFRYVLDHYPDGDMAPAAKVALERKGMERPASTEKAAAAVSDAKVDEAAAETKAPPPVSAAAPPAAEASARAGIKAHAGPFDRATLEAVEVSSGNGQTRVDLLLDRIVEYTVEYTERGARTGSPPRLDLALLHTAPAEGVERSFEVSSGQLAGIRVRRLMLSSGIRISFEMAHDSRYDIKRSGGLLSIVFAGGGAAPAVPAKTHKSEDASARARDVVPGLRIVIDPGHGGSDTGAVGPDGTLEKDVTLEISGHLAEIMRRDLRAKVWLTRTRDRDMSLEEREAFAVRRKADLFISIHANASTSRDASGVETYYLNNATDEAARRLAERENRSARRNLTEVEQILSTMLMNYDASESRKLAAEVQSVLVKRLGGATAGGVRNRGVRSALFYVLVGAKCPAILVETAFISNPREEKLLASGKHQSMMARAIADGVQNYISSRMDRVATR